MDKLCTFYFWTENIFLWYNLFMDLHSFILGVVVGFIGGTQADHIWFFLKKIYGHAENKFNKQ